MILGAPSLMFGGKKKPLYVGAAGAQSSAATVGARSASLTFSVGSVAGDLLVMYLVNVSSSAAAMTIPAGWTTLLNVSSGASTNAGYAIATRVMQVGDTNWLATSTCYSLLGAILTFRASSGLGVYSENAGNTGTGINLALGSVLSLLFSGASGGATAPDGTVPSGMTERIKILSNAGASRAMLQVSTEMSVSNGPTGNRVSSTTGTGARRSTMLEVKGK